MHNRINYKRILKDAYYFFLLLVKNNYIFYKCLNWGFVAIYKKIFSFDFLSTKEAILQLNFLISAFWQVSFQLYY